MTESIVAALVQVRAAFDDAARPAVIEVSPLKNSEDYEALLQVPREDLNAEQLFGYVFSVFYSVGGPEDFKYFFPRLLELASEDGTEIGREVLFQKPVLAGWPLWRNDRVLAFQAYLTAVIESFRTHCWSDGEMDSWICALSFCVADLDLRLGVLMAETEAANRNMIGFYESNSGTLLKRNRLSNSFWPANSKVHDNIVAWLNCPEVIRRIDDIYRAWDV